METVEIFVDVTSSNTVSGENQYRVIWNRWDFQDERSFEGDDEKAFSLIYGILSMQWANATEDEIDAMTRFHFDEADYRYNNE